ncbi:MAG: type II toxin-antitoxin system RelE/ParE family toxin [Bacteroidetes bacterium]|nr:type II toxin-antitoxin system RelE/ParE family toxin [Bacteroidota bacterium]
MKIAIDRSFERDIKKLPKQVQLQAKEIIIKIQASTGLSDFNPVKMEGSKNAFRIRTGNYRIGFYLEGDLIVFSRMLDRKEI